MSHETWPMSPLPRHNKRVGPDMASEPVCVPEYPLQAAASPSFDALVDKVWSKELGVNDFIVLLTEEACRSTGATGAAVALRSNKRRRGNLPCPDWRNSPHTRFLLKYRVWYIRRMHAHWRVAVLRRYRI